MNQAVAAPATDTLIVDLLVKRGCLKEEDLPTVRETQRKERLPIEDVLLKMRIVGERDIAEAYAEYLMVPLFDPSQTEVRIDRELSGLLPEKLCRDHLLVPVALRDDVIDVAFFTAHSLHILDELQWITGKTVFPLIAPLSVIEGILGTFFEDTFWPGAGGNAGDFEAVDEEEMDALDEGANEEILHLDQPPPPGRDGRIIRFVNQMFEQAFRVGASDIHIERFEERCKIRLRADGKLIEVAPPPLSLYPSVVARIKVLSKMDIAEKRKPQDGAIALKTGDKRIDLRVNTVPTVHGEKVVLRVLDRSSIPLELSGLGFDERQSKDLCESIEMPHGLMLVTGPTGSGKSTTLYACLNRLNKPDVNICTVEDPVEYKFSGINQIQVKSQVGLTFASALRSFLRQDPDIIMVGEVRDPETAGICMRAALTGHFVLSTLHTNDALAAVNRLQDMDIDAFLLASTLRVLVAQRLIRRLCTKCRESYECEANTAKRVGLKPGQKIYRPVGCRECRDQGYRGRVGVFEVIRITEKLADMIQVRTPLPDLRRAAADQGMSLLYDSALKKVLEGYTSLEEALSVAVAGEEEEEA
ncbi:MAG: type II/IV secretion system protein [Pirellulaceae bacterium]|nr:type II/IV secretion system protein [Pirellulaceae bacterium]